MSPNRRLLLVSSSSVSGTGYLDHCESEVRDLVEDVKEIVFVPFALADREGYTATARRRFEAMGIELEGLHDAPDPLRAIRDAQGIFVGGGNTFRLLKTLQDLNLIEVIRERVAEGMPYMGTSAGSNVAGLTIRTTNDMPIVFPRSFDALKLVPFQLNPHYLDADPNSAHQGETREQRLREFHEENPTPVVAIREGSMLRIRGDRMTLVGLPGGVLFRRGQSPRQLKNGALLDDLLC